MVEIDAIATSLLEEAKRFLEKAIAEKDPAGVQAYLHAALNLGFCSLEAHMNAISAELARNDAFSSPIDQSILLEKEIRLDNGEFEAKGLRIYRLEDRILYLCRRITQKPLDRNAPWWSQLSSATDLRNELTHPKGMPNINIDNVRRSLGAVIDAIDAVYKAVYGTGLPAAGMRLDSKLNF